MKLRLYCVNSARFPVIGFCIFFYSLTSFFCDSWRISFPPFFKEIPSLYGPDPILKLDQSFLLLIANSFLSTVCLFVWFVAPFSPQDILVSLSTFLSLFHVFGMSMFICRSGLIWLLLSFTFHFSRTALWYCFLSCLWQFNPLQSGLFC